MSLDDDTLMRVAALQAAASYVAGLSGSTEDVMVTADIFLQYIEKPQVNPAQALANRAYYCVDKDSFTKIWREARDGDLMLVNVTLGTMTGPLGEYLTHKARLLKKPEDGAFVDHPGSANAVHNSLNL